MERFVGHAGIKPFLMRRPNWCFKCICRFSSHNEKMELTNEGNSIHAIFAE
jgi:hypothetical protein